MVYLTNIPDETHDIAADVPAMLENFAQVNTQFSVDHDTLLPTGASGKHFKVTLPERVADPVTSTREMAVYTKDGGTQPEVFYRQESNGLVTQITSNGYPISFVIRAFVTFNAAGAVLGTAYNVNNPVVVTSAILILQQYTCVFTFTNAMADANYSVIVTPATNAFPQRAYFSGINKTATNCTIVISVTNINQLASCNVMFLKL